MEDDKGPLDRSHCLISLIFNNKGAVLEGVDHAFEEGR